MSQVRGMIRNETNKVVRYTKGHQRRITNQMGKAIIWIIRFCIIVGISFIVLAPLFGILSKAFMSIEDHYNPLVYMIPMNFSLENLDYAIKYMDFFASFGYTVVFCSFITILQVVICAIIGYGFARYKFLGSKLLFGLVILTIVIPTQTMMTPMYIQFRYFDPLGIMGEQGINLLNTIWPSALLSLTGMGLRSGLFIFIYRQFFRGLPKEIEEAAFIDGAGSLRTFFKVMLPNAKSAIIIVLLFSFVWQYNDTFYSGVLMSSKNLISLKLNGLFSTLSQVQWITDRNQITLMVNAGVIIVIAPLIVLYLFMQQYFMEGIERSGIVG